MSAQQFTATFTQKSLVSALTQIRKGAKVHSGDNWLAHADHKYGTDYVTIIARDYDILLVTANQWHSDVEGAAWTFARILRSGNDTGEGIFCVPIRVLHDYVKTFSTTDEITFTYDGMRTHTILVKPEPVSYNMSDPVGRKLARDARNAPAAEKMVPDNLLTITCGRNKANIVGKPAADLVAWESLDTAPAVVAEAKPISDRDALIAQWSYPGASHPMRYADGASCAVKMRVRVPLALMRAYHGLTDEPVADNDADAIADAAIAAITGEEYTAPAVVAPAYVAPTFVAPPMPAPTPIRPSTPYTPRVGDTVQVIYRHENGTTTNRTVDVQRVGKDLFRGYDRTYNRTRNFEYRHLAAISLVSGKEAVA